MPLTLIHDITDSKLINYNSKSLNSLGRQTMHLKYIYSNYCFVYKWRLILSNNCTWMQTHHWSIVTFKHCLNFNVLFFFIPNLHFVDCYTLYLDPPQYNPVLFCEQTNIRPGKIDRAMPLILHLVYPVNWYYTKQPSTCWMKQRLNP